MLQVRPVAGGQTRAVPRSSTTAGRTAGSFPELSLQLAKRTARRVWVDKVLLAVVECINFGILLRSFAMLSCIWQGPGANAADLALYMLMPCMCWQTCMTSAIQSIQDFACKETIAPSNHPESLWCRWTATGCRVCCLSIGQVGSHQLAA